MKTPIISTEIRKNWLLYFSALFTWSLISYISLRNVDLGFNLLWRTIALLSFIILFFANTTRTTQSIRVKVFLYLQVLLVWGLIYLDNYSLVPILLCLIASQLPGLYSNKQAAIFLIIVNIGYYLILSNGDSNRGLIYVAIYVMLQIFAFSTLDIARREKSAKEEITAIIKEVNTFLLKKIWNCNTILLIEN